jgi:hypothetical protein
MNGTKLARRLLGSWLLLCAALPVHAQTNQILYADALQNGWANWSWATVSFTQTNVVHSGSRAISVNAGGWEALFFHHDLFDATAYTNLTFWINGGNAGGQQLVVQAVRGGTSVASGQTIGPLTAGTWRQINVPVSALLSPGTTQIDGFWIQENTGNTAPVFYVDDMVLQSGTPPPPVTNAPVKVVVDARTDLHPISPLIYGVAFASSNELDALNAPVNRSGGNTSTRYNWEANASNHAADWYYESLLQNGGSIPGAANDLFVADSLNGRAQPMLTIPIMGWVARLGPSGQRLCSFSIAKYGAQTGNDWEWFPDAGNGVLSSTGQPISTNDPTDANLSVGVDFQAGWVRHLTNRWGTASSGGLRYYILDNEWSLWHSTHRDVHAVGATMDDVRDKFCSHAIMIKNIDPGALIVGPEEWGWLGYLYSGYDQQWAGAHNWSEFPDRAAHGGQDFMSWFTDQMRQRSQTAGVRLLDLLTVHIYPQGGEYSSDISPAMQLRRNRSTRCLWDTNYVDETWIADRIMLIPRLKQWATNYPGTPIGITEYSWGADNHINGATAQADVLGIFGREGLDLATRWTVPASNSPAFNAIRMYRNYDGLRSGFGDINTRTICTNMDSLVAFSAIRTNDGALTIMVVNKVLTGLTPATLSLSNFPSGGSAQVWQLDVTNVIRRLPDVAVTAGTVSNLLPAQSITLFVVPPVQSTVRMNRPGTNAPFTLWLYGVTGQQYIVEDSTNLLQWTPVSTNLLVSNPAAILLGTSASPHRFLRSVR